MPYSYVLGGNCVGAKKLFCGMTCYTTEQWDSVFCCEDKIWKRKSGEICCGNRLVNNKDFLCCENVRYSLKGLQRRDVKCCRKSLYHPSNTTCCPDTGITTMTVTTTMMMIITIIIIIIIFISYCKYYSKFLLLL